MTLERATAIRLHIVNGEPLDPPLNESEIVTLAILAEEFLRVADRIAVYLHLKEART